MNFILHVAQFLNKFVQDRLKKHAFIQKPKFSFNAIVVAAIIDIEGNFTAYAILYHLIDRN